MKTFYFLKLICFRAAVLSVLFINSSSAQIQMTGIPTANNAVRAIIRSGNTVFVGGDFTTFGGVASQYLAAFDANT
jgi:hypothetical protein